MSRIFLSTLLSFLFMVFANAKAPTKDIQLVLTESNTVVFNQAFSYKFVAKIQAELLEKSIKLEDSDPLYLVIDSPGGSILAGLSLLTFIESLTNPVHTVTIFAASMAYITVQFLNTRYITRYGVLMSHKAWGEFSGQFPGELNTRVNFFTDMVQSINRRVSKRLNISLSDYQKLINAEYFVFGKNAVTLNHADRVATIVCDKTLSGTVDRPVNTSFGRSIITMSKCPLISFPLEIKVYGERNRDKIIEEVYRMFRSAGI